MYFYDFVTKSAKILNNTPVVSNNPDISDNSGQNVSDSSTKLDYLKSGDFLGAIDYYTKLYNNTNSDVKLNNENAIYLVDSYLKYGNYYYSEEEYANKASIILENIKDKLGDDIWQYYYYYGYINEITQKYRESLDFYNKSLDLVTLDEKKAHIINQLGHVYDLMGEYEVANKYYVKSEKMGFHIVSNLINRGRYEVRIKNYDNAESYFNNVIGLNFSNYINSEMYSNLSNIYLGKEDGLDKAIEYANKGIEAYDKYAYNYLSLGISYIYKGGEEIDKALENFNKVIELHPNSSNGYKWLGIYYYTIDDYQKAVESFEKQKDVSDFDISLMKNEREESKKFAIYDLAKTYALMGNTSKSMIYLNQVLDGNNNNLYYSFLRDFSLVDGPFTKILDDSSFKENVDKIIILYNKK